MCIYVCAPFLLDLLSTKMEREERAGEATLQDLSGRSAATSEEKGDAKTPEPCALPYP